MMVNVKLVEEIRKDEIIMPRTLDKEKESTQDACRTLTLYMPQFTMSLSQLSG